MASNVYRILSRLNAVNGLSRVALMSSRPSVLYIEKSLNPALSCRTLMGNCCQRGTSSDLSSNSSVSPARSVHTSSHRFNEYVFNVQDEDDFANRVTKCSTPVVVDFYATWCGPCKLLMPRLESLVAGKEGSVVMAKVDIDQLSELAIEHGVEAVPTVVAMKDGKVVDKFIGMKDDAELESFVAKLIN